MKKKIMLVLFIVFLLLMGYIKYNYRPLTKEKLYIICQNKLIRSISLEENISLLVWNIHKESFHKKFKKEIQNSIETKRINFILLQEYNIKSSIKKQSNCIFEKIFTPNTITIKNDSISGVMNASKYYSCFSKSILTKELEPISNTPKISLISKYSLENSPLKLMIINIHGINFKLTIDAFKRQIKDLIPFIFSHDGPIIFAGDFNTWNSTRLNYLKENMEKVKMTEVAFSKSSIKRIFGNQLDHIFYTRKYMKLLDSDLLDNLESSDHTALYAKSSFVKENLK